MSTIKAFTPEQLHAFLAKTQEHETRAYILFLLSVCHGLRVSEAIELRRQNFSITTGGDIYLTVQRLKGSNKTTQKLLASSDQLLDEASVVAKYITDLKPKDFLFTNERGERLTRWGVNYLMTRYGTWAGLPPDRCHPHCLKHSLGILMRQSGAKLETIQAALGHKKLDSTAMYLRTSAGEADDARQSAFVTRVAAAAAAAGGD
jgi:integrase/recombinase XerD